MALEKNIPSTPAKILTSACFWACVSLAFPIFTYLGKAVGSESSFVLGYQDFLRITKYFDAKLFWGLCLGGLIFLGLVKLMQLILNKFKPNPERNMMSYVVDEVFSQLVGIGSIINIANIVIWVFKGKIFAPEESSTITEYGWLGLALWVIAALLLWLAPSKKIEENHGHNKEQPPEGKHV